MDKSEGDTAEHVRLNVDRRAWLQWGPTLRNERGELFAKTTAPMVKSGLIFRSTMHGRERSAGTKTAWPLFVMKTNGYVSGLPSGTDGTRF